MYEIRLSDGSPVFYQNDADYTAFDIECYTAKGDAGYLRFTMPKDNPAWGTLVTRKSMLEFVCDSESIGFFEVRELTHDTNFDENVYAVGELAWLFDSIQPQAEFHNMTVRDFVSQLVSVHNAQCPDHQFTVGIVDVVDSNDSLYRFTNRETTLDDLREKLVERLGGQLRLRRVNGVRYLDYLTDDTYGSESTQRIYFGENMLDYSDTLSAADVCSAVIPLGYRLENSPDNSQIGNLEKRLTIESVNGGSDYITDPTLVTRFGNVRTVKVWDDVTVPENLMAKARAWLQSDQFETMHLTLRAVDLSLTSKQFGRLRCGDFAVVVARPYGLNRRFPITSRTYHPESPESDTIELGTYAKVAFTATATQAAKANAREIELSEERQTGWLADAIANTTAMMTGERGGYKLTEFDSEGRWIADYIMDSMTKETARVVKKVTVDGTAYSSTGVDGPYDTAILANGTILGKYIQAHSIKAEQISQEYTSSWEDADAHTLNEARSEFQAADAEIAARVTQVETTASGLRTDLAAEVRVRADQISQTVKRGQINSAIEQTAETIYIKSNKFGWNSSNSSLTTDGTLRAQNATFTNATMQNSTVTGSFACGTKQYAYCQMYGGGIEFSYNNRETLGITSIASYTDGTRGGRIYLKSGATHLELRAPRISTTTSTNLSVPSQQCFSGSIWLTYGNGGTIYLNVVNGLIMGWSI